MVKILTHNINGIRAILKKDNIIDNISKKDNTYLNYIKKENPDIICWNELKICNDKYNKEFGELLPEYPYKCLNLSTEKKGYAGVSIFSKIKPILSCNNFDDNSSGRYSMMEFDKFVIICIYIMNSGDKLKNLDKRNEWDKLFLDKIKKIQKKYKNKEIIITGDFNVINRTIDTHNYDLHKNKLAGVSEVEMNNFHTLLKETKLVDVWLELNDITNIQYSYYTYRFQARKYKKGMRIDYFLLNKKSLKKIKNIEIKNDIYGSDHLVLLLEINI